MTSRVINATEAARNFSEVLNQVKYQSVDFDVMRGRELVARIVPATPAGRLSVADLNRFFAGLPSLGEQDAEAFEQDVETLRNRPARIAPIWD